MPVRCLRRVLCSPFLAAALLAGCGSATTPYDSEALRRIAPIVEMDRAAVVATGEGLELAAVRDAAEEEGLAVSIGASRGLEDLSVETISANGVQRAFAMLDGADCLFGIVDTSSSPPPVYWLLVEDIYAATDVTASATCSASAYFAIDLTGTTLSVDPSSPTRLG